MSISRRNFFHTSAGIAGAGLLFDTALSKPFFAADEAHRECPVLAEPIPHTIATPFGTTIHHFFPGPVEGLGPVTGHDPSEITNFKGVVAQADLLLSGTGTDLNTGASAHYGFHTDMRFFKGQFVAADGVVHKGVFAFIWLDSLAAASPLGLHSYDAGISPTLVTWIAAVPEGSASADFDAGTAHLQLRNICSVLDAFSVPNSLNPTRPMGNPVSAEIESLDIEWSVVTRSVLGFSDPVNQFRGDFFECSASIQVTVHTDVTTGHGFRFVSSQTTAVNFAQFGRERNGSFF